MTSRLKDIIARANQLATAKGIRNASDDDFLARVEAVCLVRHINLILQLDNAPAFRTSKRLYPQLALRINSKQDANQTTPLVKGLRRLIYGYPPDIDTMVSDSWKNALAKYELDMHKSDIHEISFADLPEDPTVLTDIETLSDQQLLAWCEDRYEWPVKELKRRAGNSTLMQVAYLRALATKEFERIDNTADERLLRLQLKRLDEKIIPDLLTIRITSAMSVPTLNALQTIYTLRSDLAFKSHDKNEPTYANLQCHRLLQISKALKTKYRKTTTHHERIEIIELIDSIEQTLTCTHSDFALTEAAKLNRFPAESPRSHPTKSASAISQKESAISQKEPTLSQKESALLLRLNAVITSLLTAITE